jgi:hypothetical protein
MSVALIDVQVSSGAKNPKVSSIGGFGIITLAKRNRVQRTSVFPSDCTRNPMRTSKSDPTIAN